jgi:hypothetical protein
MVFVLGPDAVRLLLEVAFAVSMDKPFAPNSMRMPTQHPQRS